MKPPRFASITTATLLAVLLLIPYTAAAQTIRAEPSKGGEIKGAEMPAAAPAPPPQTDYPPYKRPVSAYVPPRTPDGQPDISGLYLPLPLPRGIETPRVTPPPIPGGGGGEYSFNVNAGERPKMPEGAETRPAIVVPSTGIIPLRPEALEKRRHTMDNQDKVELLDGRVLCLPPGNIRTMIPAPVVGYQILQKPGHVVLIHEQSHLQRSIPVDGRPALHKNIRKAMGVSRGRWEGNTLVVEVTQHTTTLGNDWIFGAASANPHYASDALRSGHGISHSDVYKVTERFTPIDANTIHYEAVVDDPKVFTEPVTLAYYAFTRAPKDYVTVEYACFEGNKHNLQLMTGTDISHIRVDVP